MIQVKLFYLYGPKDLEKRLNDFLASGEVAEVIDIKFKTDSGKYPYFNALVIYKK